MVQNPTKPGWCFVQSVGTFLDAGVYSSTAVCSSLGRPSAWLRQSSMVGSSGRFVRGMPATRIIESLHCVLGLCWPRRNVCV